MFSWPSLTCNAGMCNVFCFHTGTFFPSENYSRCLYCKNRPGTSSSVKQLWSTGVRKCHIEELKKGHMCLSPLSSPRLMYLTDIQNGASAPRENKLHKCFSLCFNGANSYQLYGKKGFKDEDYLIFELVFWGDFSNRTSLIKCFLS